MKATTPRWHNEKDKEVTEAFTDKKKCHLGDKIGTSEIFLDENKI